MECYTLQTGVTFCTHIVKRQSKKPVRVNSIININGEFHNYKIEWTQQYHCYRAGKLRLKPEAKDALRRRNAPGSKLLGCSAAIFTRLEITLPKLTAHLNTHDPHSIEDQLTLKPIFEVKVKVAELVEFQLMKQFHLKLSLSNWVKRELIPCHIKEGIISEAPSSYNRAYFPSNEDLWYLAKQAILKHRDHLQDQNAIAQFLKQQKIESQLTYIYILLSYVRSSR